MTGGQLSRGIVSSLPRVIIVDDRCRLFHHSRWNASILYEYWASAPLPKFRGTRGADLGILGIGTAY